MTSTPIPTEYLKSYSFRVRGNVLHDFLRICIVFTYITLKIWLSIPLVMVKQRLDFRHLLCCNPVGLCGKALEPSELVSSLKYG